MFNPISLIAGQIAKTALPEEFVRPLAWVVAGIGALAIVVPLLLWAKVSYDSGVVEDAVNEANVTQLEELNEALGDAGVSSDERRAVVERVVKSDLELIDEAQSKNCVVADYLLSRGADCVPTDGGAIRGTAP